MKIKALLILFCHLIVIPLMGQESWTYSQEILLQKDHPYHILDLSHQVYAASKTGLGDLRIIDGEGNTVPYYFQGTLGKSTGSWTQWDLQSLPPLITQWEEMNFEIHQEKNNSHILIGNPMKLPLTGIILTTQGTFSRRATLQNIPYQLNHYGMEEVSFPMDLYSPVQEDLKLVIENQDNTPLEIHSIKANYLNLRIIFPHAAEPLSLIYGNSRARAPQYDLETFHNQIRQESLGKAQLGLLTYNENDIAEPEERGLGLFHGIIILLAVSIIWTILRLLGFVKKKK